MIIKTVKLFKNPNSPTVYGIKRCKSVVKRCMAKGLKRLVLRREQEKEKYCTSKGIG